MQNYRKKLLCGSIIIIFVTGSLLLASKWIGKTKKTEETKQQTEKVSQLHLEEENDEVEEQDKNILESEVLNAVQLDVPEVYQEPELPNGCESVSLTMALMYEGFNLEKTTIADEYLIYSDDDDLGKGYVGDPKTYEGTGCFPPILEDTANEFLKEKKSDKKAEDISGLEFEELFHYLSQEIPVIVWGTMYMEEPWFTEYTYERDGITYTWYNNEHCVVLSGYNQETGTVTVNDPLEGIVERNMDEFKGIYDEIGRYAVVVH